MNRRYLPVLMALGAVAFALSLPASGQGGGGFNTTINGSLTVNGPTNLRNTTTVDGGLSARALVVTGSSTLDGVTATSVTAESGTFDTLTTGALATTSVSTGSLSAPLVQADGGTFSALAALAGAASLAVP